MPSQEFCIGEQRPLTAMRMGLGIDRSLCGLSMPRRMCV